MSAGRPGADFDRGAGLDTEADRVFRQVRRWRDQGLGVALFTVVRTWGSAPQRPGSHLAVAQDGQSVGSVSSGCVEDGLIDAARRVIADGRPQLLPFDVGDPQAWACGLVCGGSLEVLVERVE